MKKKIMIFLSIFIFMISVVILLFGVKENNNAVTIVGFILLAIVNLLNIVRNLIDIMKVNK